MYRRAKVAWLPSQPIYPDAIQRSIFGRAQATPRPPNENLNGWYLFRRRFALGSAAASAPLAITCDGRYQLYVNGSLAGRGPVRSEPRHQRFDRYDIAERLVPGENVVAVLVHTYGVDTAFYERPRGEWTLALGDGGLWVEAEVHTAYGERVLLDTAGGWRCMEAGAWNRDAPRLGMGLGFMEDLDSRELPSGWDDRGFDDSSWPAVQTLVAGGGPPESPFGGMTIEPWPLLIPAEIPAPAEYPVAPTRVAWWMGAVAAPGLEPHGGSHGEDLIPLPGALVDHPDALLSPGAGATTVRTRPGLDVTFLLEFDRIRAGYPFVDVEARGGEVVEIAAAEGVPGEFDDEPPPPRIEAAGLGGRSVSRYVCRPGRQRFERFEWTAVKWLQVTVKGAPAGLAIHHVGATATHYPAESRGSFQWSDPVLTQLWEVARHTLLQCMHDGWVDCPGREQRQWLGDATVEFLVAQAAFGPSVNPLNRQFLEQAAESQREDGLTQMYTPGDHGRDILVIPDWTLQWILNAGDHLAYTGDLVALDEIYPAIQRALQWFERQRDGNGLLADLPYWHFMDWAAHERRGEACAVNAQYAGALRAASRIGAALGDGRSGRYARAADEVAGALNARHWDLRRGCFVDSVEPVTGAQGRRVSQHGNGAALLWGDVPPDRVASAIARMADPARLRFTTAMPINPRGEPMDDETDVVLANTFYGHFVGTALGMLGRADLALEAMRARFGPMLAKGATTLWESFAPTASLCHGFSTSPLYQLSRFVLGVEPIEPGFRRFAVAPQPAGLSWAKGVFPSVAGDIQVSWALKQSWMELDLVVPADSVAEVRPPAGFGPAGGVEVGPGTHRIVFTPGT